MKKIFFSLALCFYINAQDSEILNEDVFLPEHNQAPILDKTNEAAGKKTENNESDIALKEINGILESDAKTPIELFENKEIEPTDYSYCKKYYGEASTKVDNLRAIKINLDSKSNKSNNGVFIGFSKTRPKSTNIKKYDPFTGLFMLKSAKAKYSYTLMNVDEHAKTSEIASINSTSVNIGKIQGPQGGFTDYATFSRQIPQNAVISNICYQIYGLGVGDNNFIEKEYINRFIYQDKISYGDIGVRFKLKDKQSATFEIQYSDPFFEENPLKKGDILVSINNQAPKDTKDLQLLIANLEINSIASVKIRRNNILQQFQIKVGSMHGGYLLPDTFLEKFDLTLNNDFKVQKVATMGPLSSLRVGDKLIAFDNLLLEKYKSKTTPEKNKNLREIFTLLQNKRLEIIEKKALQKKEEEQRIKEKQELDPDQKLLDGSNTKSNKEFVKQDDFKRFAGIYQGPQADKSLKGHTDQKNKNQNFELLNEKNIKSGNEIIKNATDALIDNLQNPENIQLSVEREGNIIKIPLFDK